MAAYHAWLNQTARQVINVLAFLGLLLLTRLLTPREDNVNLAFRVAPGWEALFPSYPLYLLLLVGVGALTFFLVERGLQRVFG